MLAMIPTSRAVPEASCSPSLGLPTPSGAWAKPAGVGFREPSGFAGRVIPTNDTLTTGIRGRRPTSCLDRWTG